MQTQMAVFEFFWCLMKFILLNGMVVFAYWRVGKKSRILQSIVIIESVEILIYTCLHFSPLEIETLEIYFIFARYNLYLEKNPEREREIVALEYIRAKKSYMCIDSGQSDLISWQSRIHWFTKKNVPRSKIFDEIYIDLCVFLLL